MKLKKLLKGCLNTVDSIHILEVNTDKFSKCTYHTGSYTLSDTELSAEVLKWSVRHVEDNGTEADDTKIELTLYVKYGN